MYEVPLLNIPPFPSGVVLPVRKPTCVLVATLDLGLRNMLLRELERFGYARKQIITCPDAEQATVVVCDYEVEYVLVDNEGVLKILSSKLSLLPEQCFSVGQNHLSGCDMHLFVSDTDGVEKVQSILCKVFRLNSFGYPM